MLRHSISILIISLTWAAAQEQSVKPGINDKFLDPKLKVEEWTQKFETESREIYSQRTRILENVGLKPGMQVADIGAGTGLFTLPFATAVGKSGKVYAVEIAQNFLDHISARAKKVELTNVEPILCTSRSVGLADGSIDLAFICDVYHHFEFPQDSMTSLFKAMKSGGEVVLIDFKRIPGRSSEFVMGHVRAGQEVFEAEIKAAGFEKVGEVNNVLLENYFVKFRKPLPVPAEAGPKIIGEAFTKLSATLTTAIAKDGVANALPVCSEMAPQIAAQVAQANGVKLRRASSKPRNAKNAADAAEEAVLAAFAASLQKQESPKPNTVANPDGSVHFYAPILLAAPVCLQCHGNPDKDIAPATMAAIKKLYPEDKATGFQLGDLRGLWRVTFPAPVNSSTPTNSKP